jgi:biopolymer transport protein ExbD
MRRPSILLTTAFLTFMMGVGANTLINYFATDEVIETLATCSNYAPSLMLWREPKLVPPAVRSCGHFVITVSNDRQLYLNSHRAGSLDNPRLLIGELESAFRVRTDYHVYRQGMERAYDVPEDERIDKTVYLKAGRGLSYGEVHDLIERIKTIGANPIGLVSDPEYLFTDE